MKTSLLLTVAWLASIAVAVAELRVGLIGTDTSHVKAFADALNDPAAKGHVPGARVVAAFQGGSPDLPASATRVQEFAQYLRDRYDVKFHDRIEDLCAEVDAVLLTSVDGRVHLAQAQPVIAARKPLFIDKPMAASLRDVVEIFRLAEAAKVPVFSSSGLRFATNTQAVRQGSIGRVQRAETYSPCTLEPHHPDLFWYGVHGVEALFTVMGVGCETVQRVARADNLIEVVGNWSGGRKGTYREDKKAYHGRAWGERGEAAVGSFDGYLPLVAAVVKFFQTGVPPVTAEETIEIFAFMEAADESRRRDGAPVAIRETLSRAQAPPNRLTEANDK